MHIKAIYMNLLIKYQIKIPFYLLLIKKCYIKKLTILLT